MTPIPEEKEDKFDDHKPSLFPGATRCWRKSFTSSVFISCIPCCTAWLEVLCPGILS